MGINVCCPYLRTRGCADTKEHRHIICKLVGIISNEDTVFKCISDHNWCACEIFNEGAGDDVVDKEPV